MKHTKITYYDSLKIIPKIEGLDEIKNYGFISYDKQECIDIMKKTIADIIEEDTECTFDNFLDRYYFEYNITIIPSYHLEFDSNEELQEYCKSMIPSLNKDNLYDFLLSISDFATEIYDYRGNLVQGFINIDRLCIDSEIYMSENDRGLPAELFKKGDIVVRKNYPGDLYIVVSTPYDRDFICPEFPIHYIGTVSIAPLREYKDEDDLDKNCIRYARSELIKVR